MLDSTKNGCATKKLNCQSKSFFIVDPSVHDTEDQLIPSTQKVAIESTTDQSKHYQVC